VSVMSNQTSWYLNLTLQPQNCEKIHFWSLSHPVCGTLSWQPKLTKTALKEKPVYETLTKSHLLFGLSYPLKPEQGLQSCSLRDLVLKTPD
jgi:hypothetical protein